MWTVRPVLLLALLLATWLCGSCSNNVVYPAAGNAGFAAANAAIAAAAWLSVGCNFQGCPYGSYCNHATHYCESVSCEDGCPSGTVCNEGLNRCQDLPPAQIPTDRLPQDDKIKNLPTMH